jgi:hypothetical protein
MHVQAVIAVFAFLALVAGCGGLTSTEGGPSPAGASGAAGSGVGVGGATSGFGGAPSGLGGMSASGTAGGNAASVGGAGTKPADCFVGDVEICFGGCGSCTDKTSGCLHTYSEGGSVGLGQCQGSQFFDHSSLCLACLEGDVCVQTQPGLPGGLTCVERVLCEKIVASGDPASCFFSDKSRFTLDQIPDPPSCPGGTITQFCGGSCGGCPADQTCAGRSPSRPLGICVASHVISDGMKKPIPEACVHPDGHCQNVGKECFVYRDPDTQGYANALGLCFPHAQCDELAKTVPGGGACFDTAGKLTAGSL